MENINIKMIKTDTQMVDVARLRYKILHEEQKKDIHYTYHRARLVIDHLDDISFILGAYHKDKLVGTVRGTLFRDAGDERLNKIYGQDILKLMPGATLENSAYASRLVVLQEYRHHELPQMLLGGLLKFAAKANVRFGFMSALDELIPLYKHFGASVLAKGYFADYQKEMSLMGIDVVKLNQLMAQQMRAKFEQAS